MLTSNPAAEGRRMFDPGSAAESANASPDGADGPAALDRRERIELLLAMRRHLRIVHHIPGRLRVRAGAGLLELARQWRGRTIGLDDAVRVIGGIRAARVNPVAASAVIEYDPARVPPDAWHRLLDGDDAEALEILRDHVSGLDRHLENNQSAHVEGGRSSDE
jgi:hypothetical protein